MAPTRPRAVFRGIGLPSRPQAPMYDLFRIWVAKAQRVGAESRLSAFFTCARKSRRIEFAAKSKKRLAEP